MDEGRNICTCPRRAGVSSSRRRPPSHDVTELVRPELRVELRAALYRALSETRPALPFIPVQFNGTLRRVAVLVQPRQGKADDERLALVLFPEGARPHRRGRGPA
ncbi:MAG: hypothetical protein HS126_38845 [Anaerolineales bacterium]|nr:hypothetical protein [Anaerolineales bacterium]